MKSNQFTTDIKYKNGHYVLLSGEWLQDFDLPQVQVTIRDYVPEMNENSEVARRIEELISFRAIEAIDPRGDLIYEAIDNTQYDDDHIDDRKSLCIWKEQDHYCFQAWGLTSFPSPHLSMKNGYKGIASWISGVKEPLSNQTVYFFEDNIFGYLQVEITYL